MKEYKKSYWGLFIWIILLFALIGGIVILSTYLDSIKILSLCFFLGLIFLIFSLIIAIYFNEKIYWLNGVSFEDASKISSSERKEFAYKYVKRFSIGTIIFFIYAFTSAILDFSFIIDIVVFIACVVIPAITTINIELEVKK